MPDIVTAAQRVDWTPGTHCGVIGGIPDDYTLGGTLNPTGNNNDRQAAIQAALDGADAGEYVLMTAGYYRILDGFDIPDGVELLGEVDGDGMPSTFIDYRNGAGNSVIGIHSDYDINPEGDALTANAAKGDTTISIASTAAYSAGDPIVFTQTNSSTPAANPTSAQVIEHDTNNGDARLRRQLCRVTSKTGTTLTFFPPLYTALTTARGAEVHRSTVPFYTGSGIRNIDIDVTNGNSTYGILMWSCYNCWIKNVKITQVNNYVIFPYMALNCEIRDCWVNAIKGSGPNGSGIIIQSSSACLIVDNIVYKTFPHIEVNLGTSGCAFLYNFLTYNDSTGAGPTENFMTISIDTNHGPHNHFNLYDGNHSSQLMADGYFGSVSNNLITRNRIHGTNEGGPGISDTNMSQCIALKRMTYQDVVVGNVLGMLQAYWTAKSGQTIAYERTTDGYSDALPVIYQLGYPSLGGNGYTGTAEPSTGDFWADWPGVSGFPLNYEERDLDVVNTVTRKGNWNGADNAVPASESLGGDTILDSYAYTAKPASFGSLEWPPYDPASPRAASTAADIIADAEAIPAGYRYYNGEWPPAAATGGVSMVGKVSFVGKVTGL